MVEAARRPGRWVGILVALAFGLSQPTVHAGQPTAYGDILVAADPEPAGVATHGYTEYWLTVKNRSADAGHMVELSLPATEEGGREEYMRAVTRSVVVGPGETARVALLAPDLPPVYGTGVRVSVDGRGQTEPVALKPVLQSDERAYSGRSHRYLGFYSRRTTKPPSSLVLLSQGVPVDFLENAKAATTRVILENPGMGGPAFPPGVPGGPAGAMAPPPRGFGPMDETVLLRWGSKLETRRVQDEDTMPYAVAQMVGLLAAPGGDGALIVEANDFATEPFVEFVRPAPPAPPSAMLTEGPSLIRSDVPVAIWSSNWLGYSRNDGVVITADELRKAPEGVRTALWQYAEAGGVLLVLGKPGALPEGWRLIGEIGPLLTYSAGFGHCFASSESHYDRWAPEAWSTLNAVWRETARPFEKSESSYDRAFPIVEQVGVPVRGLFFVMFVFVMLIGPVNLFVLARMRRRIWLLWTAPLISFVTILAVLGTMIIVEGWEGHVRTEAITILDEATHRATSVGWTGVYAPLPPSDGLHFDASTEATFLSNLNAPASTPTVEWGADQHFSRGWVQARIPTHFVVRKSETRRERLTVTKEKDGTPTIVNALGAPISQLWYSDDKGALYSAINVPAGGEMRLKPIPQVAKDIARQFTFRYVYLGDWLGMIKEARVAPRFVLPANTYLATFDESPFVEHPLRNAGGRKAQAVVFGLHKESAP